MPRAALCLAATAGCLAAVPAAVRADCAAPRVAFAPAAGATLPPAPVLHVFIPVGFSEAGDLPGRVTVLGDGAPIDAVVERATRGDAGIVALRVRPAAGSYAALTVKVAGLFGAEASYAVDRSWRAGRRGAAALGSILRERDQWSCSHTDALILELTSDAPAYQVEWASSADAWDTGAQHVQVLPRDRDAFWSRAGTTTARGTSTLGLGHMSCLGETLPERALQGPLYVRVTGLFADGTTTARWAAPVLLTEADTVTDPDPDPEPDPEPDPDPVSDPEPDPVSEHEHEHGHGRPSWPASIALTALIVAGFAAMALIIRARRRRASATTRAA